MYSNATFIIFFSWLDKNVDISEMPPPTTVKGMSYKLWDGMRITCQGRLYLYPLTKHGTYNHRQNSTLDAENSFGELTARTRNKPTAEEVERHIGNSAVTQIIRADTRR